MTEHNYCRLVRWIGRVLHTERYFLIQELLVMGLGGVTVFFTPLLHFQICIYVYSFLFLTLTINSFPFLWLSIHTNIFVILGGSMYFLLNIGLVSKYLSAHDDQNQHKKIQNLNITLTTFFPIGVCIFLLRMWKKIPKQKNNSFLYRFLSWRFLIQEILIITTGILILILLQSIQYVLGITLAPNKIITVIILVYFLSSGIVFYKTKSSKAQSLVKYLNTILLYWAMMFFYFLHIFSF